MPLIFIICEWKASRTEERERSTEGINLFANPPFTRYMYGVPNCLKSFL